MQIYIQLLSVLILYICVKLTDVEDLIYIASDNRAMSKSNLIDWLNSFYMLNPEYSNWNFDDITGGEDYFFDLAEYEDVKEFFKKNIQDNEFRHSIKNRKSLKELQK